jgi:hypothetical protein
VDVIGMAVRVEDLDQMQALLADDVDDLPLAHGGIDEQRVVPIVDQKIAPVVVGRNAPGDDSDHVYAAVSAQPRCADLLGVSASRTPQYRSAKCVRSLSRTPRPR